MNGRMNKRDRPLDQKTAKVTNKVLGKSDENFENLFDIDDQQTKPQKSVKFDI